MASPSDNAQVLLAYWRTANGWRATTEPTELLARAPALVRANLAARELVAQAKALPAASARAQVIGRLGVIDTALLAEAGGATDATSAALSTLATAIDAGAFQPAAISALYKGLADLRPPRLILLEGVYACATRWFTSDPAGITSWLQSASVSTMGAINTVANDRNPFVVAAFLKILGECPIPELWARALTNANALPELDARLPGSSWNQASRLTVQTLSALAQGRIAQALTVLPISGLPMFPDGNGAQIATLPKRPRFQWGPVVAGGTLGMLVGGAAHARSKQRAN